MRECDPGGGSCVLGAIREPIVHGNWLEKIGNEMVVGFGLLVWLICIFGVCSVGFNALLAAGHCRSRNGKGRTNRRLQYGIQAMLHKLEWGKTARGGKAPQREDTYLG